MAVPADMKFLESHEWVKVVEGNIALVGISDFAQQELSDVVFVETPEVGDEVEKGGECGVVESVKTASDIYSPVSGKIVEVNEKLSDAPGLLNTSPFADGWIFKIEMSDSSELDGLLDAAAYEQHIA